MNLLSFFAFQNLTQAKVQALDNCHESLLVFQFVSSMINKVVEP
jgi:hypothetical protein